MIWTAPLDHPRSLLSKFNSQNANPARPKDANCSGLDHEASMDEATWRGTKYVQKADDCLSCLFNLFDR